MSDEPRDRHPCGKLKPERAFASQSFTVGQVNLLDQLIAGMLRGADVSALARAQEFKEVARKVGVMKRTIERKSRGKGGDSG